MSGQAWTAVLLVFANVYFAADKPTPGMVWLGLAVFTMLFRGAWDERND